MTHRSSIQGMPPPDVAQQVEQAVLRRLEADDLVLPALPAAASRSLELLSSEDFSFGQVAALIETDPILAARIVRLANGARFGGFGRLASIVECVTRLGGSELRSFLFETAARQVIESRDKRIAEICRGLWDHSLGVAILAREIATRTGGPPGAAYLGGLLHDIGKPILAAMLLDAEQRLLGTRTRTWIVPDTWMRLIGESHRAIGVALAARWGLPDEVGRAIGASGDYDTADPTSLANTVRLANAVAKREGLYVGAVDDDETESLVFVGHQLFGIPSDGIDAFVRGLRDQVNGRAA